MRIRHGRLALELHELARRDGPALLLLHALYGSSRDWDGVMPAWSGAVYALDFCGHGRSEWVTGGAYSPELLLGDADAALEAVGTAAVAGAGLGAYIALLLAGARATRVCGALLLPGAGLAGGGPSPDFSVTFPDAPGAERASMAAHDPLVWTLDHFIRPPEYVVPFAHTAQRLVLLEDDESRPPWWEAVRQSPRAETVHAGAAAALRRLSDSHRTPD
jgi:pimeloyl-ACP methyl ester carboxylesterase